MQKVKNRFFWIVCLIALVTAVFATQVQAGKALDQLNAFFTAKGAIRANFVQTVQGSAFAQPKESRGTLMIQRPGKFRWDYQTPYQQLILADGKRLWIYDKDLDQVVVKPLDLALGDTPALLLSGKGLNSEGVDSSESLQQRFIITELDEPRNGLYWVQLLPRAKESNFQEMRLAFGEKHISRMELVDGFGQQTQLIFSELEANVNLPADNFIFVPPKGVDVVGNPDVDSGK